jgi:hypothetical protein
MCLKVLGRVKGPVGVGGTFMSQNAGWEESRLRHYLVLLRRPLVWEGPPTLGPYCMHNLPPWLLRRPAIACIRCFSRMEDLTSVSFVP